MPAYYNLLNGDSANYFGAACASEGPTLTHPLQPVAFHDFGRKGCYKIEGETSFERYKVAGVLQTQDLGIQIEVAKVCNITCGDIYEQR